MSRSHWLLAVLEDLRNFASTTGMEHLEQQLKLASWTASRELPDANSDPETAPQTNLEIEDVAETPDRTSETRERS